MKVGMIGVGGMGATHNSAVKALSEKMDVEVTAIADMLPKYREEAAKLWPQAHIYTDGFALLREEALDCVHICVPSYLHTELAVAAMEKGIHVLIEKPVALNEEDCRRLLETKARTGVRAMVGQVVRFFPEYELLKTAYESGKYGRLKSLVMQRLSQDVLWGYENWFQEEGKSGSVVLDLHIHDADFVRYMLGEPQGFQVQATAYENGMINQILTIYDYPGCFVSAEAVWDVTPALPFQPSYRAYFEDATITFHGRENPSVKIWKKDGAVEEPQLRQEEALAQCSSGINIQSLGSYYTEIAYFYDCLAKGLEPEKASLEEGVASVRLMLRELEAAHRALRG